MTDSRGRAHRPVQRVPAAPLVEWLAQRLAAYEADVTTPRLHQHGVSPAVRMLSEDLGISDRTLYRYSRSLSANGQPTDSFRRSLVQDMLESAGVRFDDIYPEDPDVPLEPMAFCPTCEAGVNPIGGKCPWCNTGTGKAPVGIRYTQVPQNISDRHLRSMHVLHTGALLPISEIAAQSWRKFGYSGPESCNEAIRRGWKRMGFKTVSHSRIMRAVAARREIAPQLEEQTMREAIFMHQQCGMSAEAVARALVSRSRTTHPGYLAQWLRDEFKARGVYVRRSGKDPVRNAA